MESLFYEKTALGEKVWVQTGTCVLLDIYLNVPKEDQSPCNWNYIIDIIAVIISILTFICRIYFVHTSKFINK